MKNILSQFKIALALVFLSQLATAQEAENPYAIFGSTQKVLTEPTGVIEEVLHIGSESDEMSYKNQMARREVLLKSIRARRGEKYRFGFNGMERDDDFAMGSYDFGARLYNPALGRWNARDPLESKYPNISTYTFVANSPLRYIDPDGKDIIDYLMRNKDGNYALAYSIFSRTSVARELLSIFYNHKQSEMSIETLKGIESKDILMPKPHKDGALAKHILKFSQGGVGSRNSTQYNLVSNQKKDISIKTVTAATIKEIGQKNLQLEIHIQTNCAS